MFKKLPFIALCSLLFAFISSCTSDVGSLEAGPVASYTFTSSAPVVAGVYVVSRQMNSTNTVTLQINVTVRGAYTIRTATQNGVYFQATGIFTNTGQQSVVLYGFGIPVNAGNFTYSAGSGASFGITFNSTASGASFTYSGAPGACSAPSINGVYAAGVAMGAGNYVDLAVNVTTIGVYSVSTNSAGGINFSASGTFGSTGSQTIRLTASGTPSGAGTYSFTPSGGCSFSITVVPPPPPAAFTYTCATPSISGTFAAGTALTSASTITVPVNVTVAGIYSVTTDLQNGVTFSASGVFSGTGAQNIVLTSTNTPSAAGTFSYTPAGAGCSFDITYTGGGGGGGGSDFIKCTIDNVFIDFSTGISAQILTGIFSATGDNASGSKTFDLSVVDVNGGAITVGTYSKQSLTNLFRYCDPVYTPDTGSPFDYWSTDPINSNQFTITITSITATRVTGTFSGDLFDTNGANKKVVTNGSFSVPL